MKLSIVVPVYNVEKYLPACIDSIISQTFTDWELILVDDGSNDDSGRICDEYSKTDSRIRVLHYENGGASEARNRGVKESNGDFITFIDSDDIVLPDFLSHFSYDEKLDFEIQGFTINYIGHEQDNIAIKPVETKIAPVCEIYAEAELNKLSRGPVCKLFKRSVIIENNVVYPKGIQFGEDAIFVKRYLSFCCGKARSVAKSDYIYNHFPDHNSLTSQRIPGQIMYDVAKMDYELFEKLEAKWGKLPGKCVSEFKYMRTLEMYYSICSYLTEGGHTKNGKIDFLNTLKSDLYKKNRDITCLPITYRIIRFSGALA